MFKQLSDARGRAGDSASQKLVDWLDQKVNIDQHCQANESRDEAAEVGRSLMAAEPPSPGSTAGARNARAFYRVETFRRMSEASGEGVKTAVELMCEEKRIKYPLKIHWKVSTSLNVGE